MLKQKLSRDKELINFIIQWTCGILAVAAAIVFGIWAPLSYEATASANRSNDAAQSSMVDALSRGRDMAMAANSIAMTATSIAKSAATAQSSALLEMQNRMALMGQLAVIDFCITQSVWFLLCMFIFARRAVRLILHTLKLPLTVYLPDPDDLQFLQPECKSCTLERGRYAWFSDRINDGI